MGVRWEGCAKNHRVLPCFIRLSIHCHCLCYKAFIRLETVISSIILLWASYHSVSLSVSFRKLNQSVQLVQSLSRVQLFATPWIATCQASLSITNTRSTRRLTSIESVMPSSHLILGRPLLLLPPIPPSIRVFSNESTLRMRWPDPNVLFVRYCFSVWILMAHESTWIFSFCLLLPECTVAYHIVISGVG